MGVADACSERLRVRRARIVVCMAAAVVVAACGAPQPPAPAPSPSGAAPATQLPLRVHAGAPAAPTPPPLTAKGPRPPDGEVLPAKLTGPGVLDIENGDESDAYVTLARDGRAAFTVYIWKGSKAEVAHVADGEYVVYFSTGDDWNSDVRRFTSSVHAVRFDNPLVFKQSKESGGWTVYLQPTVTGTEPTTDVPDDDVPR
jgi:hypothetical protein